ncbi:MAG TPA: flagellar biosynthesis protein FlhF [Nitrospirota bacterium]|nr:flagellar biosynthesis protein FlhF [Nitrospirota bacterium]HKZ71859.1 flagellar biosynthesis protein FlhF [Nitrospirota bacterium]
MQIKKFEAVDMQEALRLIRNDIGPDAVILSTKKVKRGDGVFGMFSRQMVEVVAARDYPDKGQSKGQGTVPYSPADAFPQNKSLMEDIQKIKTDISVTPVELRDMKAEIGVLKGYVQELLRCGEDEGLKGLSNSLVLFYRRLVSEGMDTALSGRIVRILDSKLSEEQKDNSEQINRYGLELLQKQVRTTGPVYNPQKGQKIAVFVGPTGVGKTTTIAKIAAKYTLVDKKKVSLITFDTFRIGAIEQLKIYARIIGLPVDVVLSPAELHETIRKRSGADLILVDTAGRSHKDKVYIQEIKELLNHTHTLDCHLVLSSTSSDAVLSDVINRFREIPVSGLLFTKLDEADRYGAIFNMMIRAQRPLSYFTTGQRVPEDIELAAPERLCRLILGMDAVNSH